MNVFVDIYRSKHKEGAYLYVKKGHDLNDLPEVLLTHFGVPEYAMALTLHQEKKLARVDVVNVMAALEAEGFFLQFPPSAKDYMNLIPNDKLLLNK